MIYNGVKYDCFDTTTNIDETPLSARSFYCAESDVMTIIVKTSWDFSEDTDSRLARASREIYEEVVAASVRDLVQLKNVEIIRDMPVGPDPFDDSSYLLMTFDLSGFNKSQLSIDTGVELKKSMQEILKKIKRDKKEQFAENQKLQQLEK